MQWLKLASDDVKEQIFKLAKKGLTPSQIGTNPYFNVTERYCSVCSNIVSFVVCKSRRLYLSKDASAVTNKRVWRPCSRCDPEGLPWCGPGALCHREQDTAHPEGQGSGSGHPRGPLPPDQEGCGHEEAPGEKQECGCLVNIPLSSHSL